MLMENFDYKADIRQRVFSLDLCESLKKDAARHLEKKRELRQIIQNHR